MLGPDVVVQQAIGFFRRAARTRLVSALKGISTEVETFSRKTVRPSISLRMFSRDRCERAKIRLVSPCLPGSARRRCSVSIETLPSWLASWQAKRLARPFRVTFEHPARLGVRRLLTKTSLTSL